MKAETQANQFAPAKLSAADKCRNITVIISMVLFIISIVVVNLSTGMVNVVSTFVAFTCMCLLMLLCLSPMAKEKKE